MQNTLGDFIRAHRERIKPGDVGLPEHGRRRTPGLRREELAQLCDVSPTWLTWLEQGRPVSASGKMLGRLADVMHLTHAERAYLFKVAEKHDPRLSFEGAPPEEGLDAIVAAITTPAYILNRQWDVVAWNGAASGLFAGLLDRDTAKAGNKGGNTAAPNLLAFVFEDPAARSLIVDWPERAERLVAEFRADCANYAEQEPLAAMIAALAASNPTFRQLWTSQHVVGREGGARSFMHPVQGLLRFDQATFHLSRRHDLKLVMLLPC